MKTREIRALPIGQRVQWVGASADGWAGPGIARIVSVDEARIGFEGGMREKGQPPRGPAYLLRLEHNGLTVWVGVLHVVAIGEEEEAA